MAARDVNRGIEGVLTLGVLILLLPALALVYFGKQRTPVPANAILLNTASAGDISRALGVEGEIGDRLVAYRQQLGSFDSVDQILDAPLFTRAQAADIESAITASGAHWESASAQQLRARLKLSPGIAHRLAVYRDSLLPSPPAEPQSPEAPAGAHHRPRSKVQAPQPPSAPAVALAPKLIGRARLLDPDATRPLLQHFLVRPPAAVSLHFTAVSLALLLIVFLLPAWLRSRVGGDAFLTPIALLLSGLGVVTLFSVKDPYRDRAVYEHHLGGLALSLVVMVALARLTPQLRLRIRRYQYLWVFAAVILVAALWLFGSGPEGVKLDLWHFQPVELIKLFLVFFLASYLGDRAGLIADTSRPQPSSPEAGARGASPNLKRALSRTRFADMAPMAVMFAIALTLFYVIRDLGPGLLMFGAFVSMLYLTTGRSRYVAGGVLLITLGALIGYYHHIGVFSTRVDMWLSPFKNSHPNGMQLAQSYWAMASGGAEGSGLGLGMPSVIPRSGSDLAFASWSEETGLVGAWLTLTLYAVLVWRGLRIAVRASSDFDRALAFGLTALLGLQTLLIVAGVTGAFPLTGIALPFLSYGNSALVAAFAAIGLLRGISARSPEGMSALPPRLEAIAAARRFGVGYALLLLGGIGILKLAPMLLWNANTWATARVVTPDADGISRPHTNPRLTAIERLIERGSIYDRNGRILATSRPGELKKLLHDENLVARLIDLRSRYYPLGPSCAHLVGYLSPAVGGPTGWEHAYNTDLRGFKQYTDLLADYRDRNLPGYRPRRGLDLHTTIDGKLQQRTQQVLLQAVSQLHDAKTGGKKDRAAFVAMDWKTGEVLAAVSVPTFDPNSLTPEKVRFFLTDKTEADEHRFVDRAVYGLYPPGSTLKTATAACALDTLNNAMKFEVTCNRECPVIQWQAHGMTYTRRHVRDDKGDPSFGTLTLAPAFRVSSNIYFANLAAAIGAGPLRSTLATRMGFAHVPDSAAFDADLPDIGYGQGRMLASPLEMCRLAAAVANDGELIQRRFVSSLTDPAGVIKPDLLVPTALRAMSPTTAATMRVLMRSVVTGGTARGVFTDPTIAVAGKTGTAQNRQGDREPHSWFIGFAPYSDITTPTAPPHYAFACVVENGGYGKRVAAVICRSFLQKAF